MREVIEKFQDWENAGQEQMALATVVRTWGSAPRAAGARMVITSGGDFGGSVSGGCVEAAVVEAAVEVLESGRARLLHFGVTDEAAWSVGLACGGELDVFVEPLDTHAVKWVASRLAEENEGRMVTVIRGPESLIGRKAAAFMPGDRLQTAADERLEQGLQAAWNRRSPGILALVDELEVFVDVYVPAPTLTIVGGVHIALALTELAQVLGFRTVVIDPRRAFGSEARFSKVGRLIQAWPAQAFAEVPPTARTAVVLLTHDPKIDDAALKIVLDSPAAYIGALGSRSTHAQRVQRLASYGFSTAQIARIHAPVGLDIGAAEPAEIALSILAEIVAVFRAPDEAEP